VVIDLEVSRELAHAVAKAWVADQVADSVEMEAVEEAASRSIRLISSSPALIVACLTMEDTWKHLDDRKTRAEYLIAVEGVAASIQNPLPALLRSGLASCWMCAPFSCQDVV